MRKKFGILTFGRGSPTERELKSSTYQVPMRLSEISAEQYRERAAQAGEKPDFLKLVRKWGCVTLCYRKGMKDAPA